MGQSSSHPRDQPLNSSQSKKKNTRSTTGTPSSSSSLQTDRRLARANTAPSLQSSSLPLQNSTINSTKTLSKPKPSSSTLRPPLSRNTSTLPSRSSDDQTANNTVNERPSGGKNKVMKENELISHLEQMGFARSIILECLEIFDIQKGKRTVIDPNALIEQLITKTKRTTGSDVSTSSIDPSTFFQGLRSTSISSEDLESSSSNHDNNNDLTSSQSTFDPENIVTPPCYVNPFKDLALIENSDTSSSQAASVPSSTITERKTNYINPFEPPPFNPFLQSEEVSSPRDYDSSKCKICFDRPVETVILKCAHSVMCMECSKGLKKCPICFRDIQQVIRIYTC